MNIKRQIKKLLEDYHIGKYETKTFCDLLGTLYYFEKGGYKYFEGLEKECLDDLVNVTERFSDNIEDLKNDGTYFSEQQVKNKFDEIYKKLNW